MCSMDFLEKYYEIKELNNQEILFLVPNECPVCHYTINPCYVNHNVFQCDNAIPHITLFLFCSHCNHVYAVDYSGHEANIWRFASLSCCNISQIKSLSPFSPNVPKLPENLLNDSYSKFQSAYFDACAAQSYGLFELAGIGYRRAAEFLIKDYLISKITTNEEKVKIQNIDLHDAIERIPDQRLKDFSHRVAWLGNDATHYIWKHTDRDLDDLSNFFFTLVSYITQQITIDDALTIQPIKKNPSK